ncbi:hypothetical protein HMPREF1624_01784 [Sporothrix schenckii ATCC 58251]|uniref:Zn(2)-C6 fungal-type domain-containing protein n=1 Tax=Sporothrix schenckii (strain ATCC 58251 / de Perez 2211183) TaxID=1391915 RepID=U7Q6I0_SPOS1|nr:hypothetical protein HMPREF1624_01784 [Sporothrix schenckii ATCC 58251]
MTTRSRKGCIDCKQAKIKCDEVHPACGTCMRRSRKCRGYLDTTGKILRGPGGATSLAGSSLNNANSHHNHHNPLQPMAQTPLRARRDSHLGVGGMESPGSSVGAGRYNGIGGSGLALSPTSPYMPYARPRARGIAFMSSVAPMTMNTSTIVVSILPETIATAAQIADDRSADIPWAPIELPAINVTTPDTDNPYSQPSPAPITGGFFPGSPFTTMAHVTSSKTPGPVVSIMMGGGLNWSHMLPPAHHTGNAASPSSTYHHNSVGLDGSIVHSAFLDAERSGTVDGERVTPDAANLVANHATSRVTPLSLSPALSSDSGGSSENSRSLVGPNGRRLIGPAAAAMSRTPVLDVSSFWSPPTPAPVRGPSFMPLNGILAKDKPFIEIYFLRHPTEMVMNNSMFINEMNGAVLSLLQVSPIVVGDSLCAIGENYIKEMAGDNPDSNIASHRKARLLSRLRLLNEDGTSPELVLLLLLALCGAELTNPNSDGKASSLPSLIENVAMILEFHTRAGREISTTAKYFAKGVARQDLLHSLSRMQRPKIQPSTWLDDYAMRHADRLFGLTATLTPILYKLAELAGDVQAILNNDAFHRSTGGIPAAAVVAAAAAAGTSHSSHHQHHDPSLPSVATTASGIGAADLDDDRLFGDGSSAFFAESATGNGPLHLTQRSNLAEREATIRAQLLMWRPVHDSSLSIQTSRTLLLHASAWRAAALLYLYRLFNRPGSSREGDRIALSMAYEVMLHINGPAEDIKLSLWPLFVAACELDQPEDRALAATLFGEMCQARPLMTARRTREFVMDQIWLARDRGEVWDWMQLTQCGQSNVFMPL